MLVAGLNLITGAGIVKLVQCGRQNQDDGNSASQRLTWYKPPLTVLIIKKIHDAAVISPFIQLVSWFTELKRYSEIVSLFTCNIFLAVKKQTKIHKPSKQWLLLEYEELKYVHWFCNNTKFHFL